MWLSHKTGSEQVERFNRVYELTAVITKPDAVNTFFKQDR